MSALRRWRSRYGSHWTVLPATLIAVLAGNILAALYFIPLVLSGRAGPNLLSPEGIVAAAITPDIALLAVAYFMVIRPGYINWKTMGLDRRDLGHRLFLGVGYGVILFGASALMETILSSLGIHQTQRDTFQSLTTATPAQFAMVLVAGAVIAPTVEEIFFRGYIFRAYQQQKGTAQALAYSSAIFAAIHMNLPAMLPIFVMGAILALAYYRTGSIIPGIVAHLLNNALAFSLLYAGFA